MKVQRSVCRLVVWGWVLVSTLDVLVSTIVLSDELARARGFQYYEHLAEAVKMMAHIYWLGPAIPLVLAVIGHRRFSNVESELSQLIWFSVITMVGLAFWAAWPALSVWGCLRMQLPM